MKITRYTQQIRSLPDLKVIKSVFNNNTSEIYQLLHNDSKVCSFLFTNYKGIDRYYSHAEIRGFKLEKKFRKKIVGLKATLQAKEIIKQTAKDKNIKFVMFRLKNQANTRIKKLAQHLGCYEYNIEDLSNKHFVFVINPAFYKNVKKRLFAPLEFKKNLYQQYCNFKNIIGNGE